MNKNPIISSFRQPRRILNHTQRDVVSEINKLIQNGQLKLVDNHCMCGNDHEEDDSLITSRDCWGIHVGQVLCSKCGLIRNQYVFSSESNKLFYENYYRKLYNSNPSLDSRYFKMQCKRGEEFYDILRNLSIINDINDVAELGCGAGGVLKAFDANGKNVIGVDLDNEFLEQGRSQGLNLECGDFFEIIRDDSCDLIIMSHVMEHLIDPIGVLRKLVSKIRNQKYLLIQVPSFFMNYTSSHPLIGFQIAHVFYFYKEWLQVLFVELGFEVVYCDDKCTFVLKVSHALHNNKEVWDDSLKSYPPHILGRCQNRQMTFSSILIHFFLDIFYELSYFLRFLKHKLLPILLL